MRDAENDFFGLFAGQALGEGQHRRVLLHRQDPTLVIKEEKEEGAFHNIREWTLWTELAHAPKWTRWLAPCVAISPGGRFLLQRRTSPVMLRDLPDRIPSFFTDRKVGNWGRLPDGRIVCHDYAYVVADFSLRLTKSRWWSE